jgi:hypothetical protein
MPRGKSQWEPGIPSYQKFDKNKYEICDLTGCWIWFGAQNGRGRPVINVNRRAVYAYRYFWELRHGPIPSDKELDHVVCDNPVCVNPDHLQLANRGPNAARGNYLRWARLDDLPF